MALTCRLFYEPAMHALWREMYSLKPILSGFLGMDDKYWRSRRCGTLEVLLSSAHPRGILTHHVACTQSSASSGLALRTVSHRRNLRRIQILHLERYPTLVADILQLVQPFAASPPLLPNLRCLDLPSLSDHFMDFLPMLIGPAPQRCTVSVASTKGTRGMSTALAHLSQLCPTLPELNIHPYLPLDRRAASLSKLRHLRKVYFLASLNPGAIVDLARALPPAALEGFVLIMRNMGPPSASAWDDLITASQPGNSCVCCASTAARRPSPGARPRRTTSGPCSRSRASARSPSASRSCCAWTASRSAPRSCPRWGARARTCARCTSAGCRRATGARRSGTRRSRCAHCAHLGDVALDVDTAAARHARAPRRRRSTSRTKPTPSRGAPSRASRASSRASSPAASSRPDHRPIRLRPTEARCLERWTAVDARLRRGRV